ncbi:Squalene/phytoene synthase-domain-containing protein [Lipomyces tetrasporus]|uniref:Squalene/phytoene synthase-domain-containing protein n=1 Tax=Lipomyces tetrasporus TaxID=54092 RepID=A0AAD7VQ78_9ASCO|nr:Squalene/phytoene synthase-domain-containing protein [Lipomyces tetrasporus]KAJ8097928.1 Squalene/phytoene synthase-domain-containing protein [Lipomyces tetrasporus]
MSAHTLAICRRSAMQQGRGCRMSAIRSSHSHSHSHDEGSSHSHTHTHTHTQTARVQEPPPKSLDSPSTSSAPESDRSRLSISRAQQYCASMLESSFMSPNLITPFIPGPSRDAHIALSSLSAALKHASHPPLTSSATISMASGSSAASARLRLQFWKQTIQDIFAGKTPPSEPVAILLTEAIRTHSYTRGFFTRMVDARTTRVGDPPFANISALADYGEAAYSSMLYLLGESMPSSRAVAAEHVCSHIGRAMGVVEVLSDFPGMIERRGRVLLPVDVMVRHAVREEDVLRRIDVRDSEIRRKLADAVFEVATHANDQLITARTMFEEVVSRQGGRRNIDDAMFAPVLFAVPIRVWLEKLEKFDFDLFSPKLRVKDWILPWKMYWAYRSRKI